MFTPTTLSPPLHHPFTTPSSPLHLTSHQSPLHLTSHHSSSQHTTGFINSFSFRVLPLTFMLCHLLSINYFLLVYTLLFFSLYITFLFTMFNSFYTIILTFSLHMGNHHIPSFFIHAQVFSIPRLFLIVYHIFTSHGK